MNLEVTRTVEIISTKIRDAYEPYEPLTHVHNDSGITSDFLSQLMATLLQAVNKLRKSRAKNVLSLTYGLVLELASLPYGGLETCKNDDRLSDEVADRMLGRIVKRRRDTGEQWDMVSDLVRLKCEGKKLDQHGNVLGSPRQFLSWRDTLRLSKVAMGDMLVETLCSYSLVQCFELPFAGPKCGTVSEADWTFNQSSRLGARYTVLVSKRIFRVVR